MNDQIDYSNQTVRHARRAFNVVRSADTNGAGVAGRPFYRVEVCGVRLGRRFATLECVRAYLPHVAPSSAFR